MPRKVRGKAKHVSDELYTLPCSKLQILKFANSVVAGKDYLDFSDIESKEVLSLYISLDDMIRRSNLAKKMLDKLEIDLVEL